MIGSLAAAAGAAVLALLPSALGPAADGMHGRITRVDRTWICDSRVDLDSVRVTMTPAAGKERRTADAVHLESGCTGRIGRVEITQSAGDGIKVAGGVHDLTIGGGSIRCLAKAPHLHQDGIQVMGGLRITFRGLGIDCGRADDRLINSNLFISQAGKALAPPTDVVCDGCMFGGWAAHTVSVQQSVRSGVTDSSLCLARFPELTLDVGSAAVDPVGSGNRVRQCGPGRLTIESGARSVGIPDPVVLDGLFLAQALHSPVTLERRPDGAADFVRVTTVRTGPTSRWSAKVRPGIETTYRARLGDVISPEVVVGVRPLVVLAREGARLVARVQAQRSFAGSTVTLQRLRYGGWADVGHIVLGPRSTKSFPFKLGSGMSLRLQTDAAPGYLPATSKTLTLP